VDRTPFRAPSRIHHLERLSFHRICHLDPAHFQRERRKPGEEMRCVSTYLLCVRTRGHTSDLAPAIWISSPLRRKGSFRILKNSGLTRHPFGCFAGEKKFSESVANPVKKCILHVPTVRTNEGKGSKQRPIKYRQM
jgi:hypothetical protein